MDRERFRRIERLFTEAVERPPDERAAFLDEACAGDPDLRREVDDLLAADAEEHDDPVGDVVRGGAVAIVEDGDGTAAWAGRRIGPWEIEREIGRGGMGRVLLAHRADGAFDRKVAVKVSLAGFGGAELAARLERERRILAPLDHPAIARLLDGGTTGEGVPYVVMEYVEGEPIDVHCARRGLGLRARIELFLEVCDAVVHAHRALVVHRDLKPGNILVTGDGHPKLLDFGIAKLLEPDPEGAGASSDATATMVRMWTPDYAAPEQVLGEPVTTASDVWALGVVLYELLTGARPFELAGRTPAEIERTITTTEPPRPSTRVGDGIAGSPTTVPGRRLRGDLDNIVLQALRREPQRRYASVQALADDLRRHLDGRPVSARPSTWSYRTSRFVGRHRAGVALAAAALVAVAAGVGYHVRSLSAERDRAVAAAERASRTAAFLEDLFNASTPESADARDLTAVALLDRGAERVDEELADEPLLRAALQRMIGNAYRRLAAYDAAEAMLDRALATAVEVAGDDSVEAARVRISLGSLYADLDRTDEAVAIIRRALAVLERSDGLDAKEATVVLNLAQLQFRAGAYDEAMELANAALERRRALFGDDDARTLSPLALIGTIHAQRLEHDDAKRVLEEVLDRQIAVFGEDHLDVASTLDDLSSVESDLGHLNEAIDLGERALAIRVRILPPDHPTIAVGRFNLCGKHHGAENGERALELCRAALSTFEAELPPTHRYIAAGHERLANVLVDLGRLDEAKAEAMQALDLSRTRYTTDHPSLARTEVNVARVLARAGDLRRSEELTRTSYERFRRVAGDDDVETAIVRGILGERLVDLGRAEEGRDELRAAREILIAKLGADDVTLAARTHHLARALAMLGELEEARALHEETLALHEATFGSHAATADSLHGLGVTALAAGDLPEARRRLEQALAMRREIRGGPHRDVVSTLEALADLAVAEGRPAEAVRSAREACTVADEARVAPIDVASARLALARALDAEGSEDDREEAVDAIDEALPVARATWAEGDARIVEAESLRARIATPRSHR